MKLLSHCEAVYRKHASVEKAYSPRYEFVSTENYAENGRLLKRSVVAVVDNAENNSKFSPADFKLENLAAVGAIGSLKDSKLSPTNFEVMSTVSDAAEFYNDLAELNVDNVDNNVENN